MFEKILVPLDGSEHSVRALEISIQVAKQFSGKLILIHIYSVTVRPIILPEPATLTPTGVPVMTAEEVTRVADAAREAGNRILAEGERKAKADGVQVQTMLIEGHAVQEIVKTAREGEFDLIVIGARGISKIREILLGSVTDGVIHHASCPVLVVK
jgi:nucleotide-binding universal stress UspA family protein